MGRNDTVGVISLSTYGEPWPHGDAAWPESLHQVVNRSALSESAKRKMLGENAMRLCPRLRA
jgi:hypothetical protein